MSDKPLALDLCSGLGGWAEGLEAEGWDVIRVDIVDMFAETGTLKSPNCLLMLQDIRTFHGSQAKRCSLIVASPPCTEYSWMAMPWSRAKQVARALRGDGDFPDGYTGSRTVAELTALFDACFRIQREAIEAAGHFIPLVVENVRGAIPWVGRSRWNFGSFHLWGDVPALMPMTKSAMKNGTGGSWFGLNPNGTPGALNNARDGQKVPGFCFDGGGRSFQTASVEGMKTTGIANIRDGYSHTRHLTNQAESDGVKGFTPNGEPLGKNVLGRKHGSKSKARKAVSAMIAKIPITLSRHIAKTWKPI